MVITGIIVGGIVACVFIVSVTVHVDEQRKREYEREALILKMQHEIDMKQFQTTQRAKDRDLLS